MSAGEVLRIALMKQNDNWADELKELYVSLSPEEYAAARESSINGFLYSARRYSVNV